MKSMLIPIIVIVVYIFVAGVGLGIAHATDKDSPDNCMLIILWPFTILFSPLAAIFYLVIWLGRKLGWRLKIYLAVKKIEKEESK